MTLAFVAFCAVLLACIPLVLREIRLNKKTYRDLALSLVPLSPEEANAVRTARFQGPAGVPATWAGVASLLKLKRNAKLQTRMASKFSDLVRRSTDEQQVYRMSVTYSDYVVNLRNLSGTLLRACFYLCMGTSGRAKFCVLMAKAAECYAESVMLSEEMAGVMDESCIPILEGQFHGS